MISGGGGEALAPVVDTYERSGARVIDTHERGTVEIALEPGPIGVTTWLKPDPVRNNEGL